MWIFEVKNDRWYKAGDTDRLGWEFGKENRVIPIDPNGHFAFTRCCLSIGDWGIVSALPELLKRKYPNLTIALPSVNWIRQTMNVLGNWSHGNVDATTNVDLVYANNPFVDSRFDVGDYPSIITDHHRCFKYKSEPLVEQLLRAWGFAEDELYTADTAPQLYFSDEEKQIGDAILNKYIGNTDFGCGIFSARVEQYNCRWGEDNEYSALNHIRNNFSEYPTFVYNTFDIGDWNMFPQMIPFKDIPEASLRVQMYIKYRASFNFGYQSGFGDSCAGGIGENHIITPYDELTETMIRGKNIHYYFRNGSKICYAR